MTLPVTFEVEIDSRAVEIETASNAVEVSPGTPTVVFAAVPGSPGPSGGGTIVVGETPTGAINGINTTFTTAAAFKANTTALYLNGLRETHYTESGPSEITFDDPPLAGDTITVDYVIP